MNDAADTFPADTFPADIDIDVDIDVDITGTVDGNRSKERFERITKLGWIAKGTVYLLMGVTTVQIASQRPGNTPRDTASPEGSLARVAAVPGGRLLLAVLAVGLLLYAIWRAVSVIAVDGGSWSAWGDRVGYGLSGLFYLVLAWTAARGVASGSDPSDSNTVERLSRATLESPFGRWVLGLAGLVTVGVGLYFVIDKAMRRSFADDLAAPDDPTDEAHDGVSRTLVIAGIAGWIGRGVVTIFVGLFVVRAAIRFDPNEARGFDRSLRQIAETTAGSLLVALCALGLVAYGVFCLLSYRYRSIDTATG